jgi:Type IV secretion-system coupling protein DNA-binding domain/TraM recognition site of TraD and TraG
MDSLRLNYPMGNAEVMEVPTAAEQLARQFYEWEVRGRGWLLWERPVEPEPPFVPFLGYSLQDYGEDDGRQHTLVSGLIDWLHEKVSRIWTRSLPPAVIESFEPDGPRERDVPSDLVELQISVPADLAVSPQSTEQFLLALSSVRHPIAYEIVGLSDAIVVQFACEGTDVDQIQAQLKASFPEISLRSQAGLLAKHWQNGKGGEEVVVEFGLEREFMLPLADFRSFAIDPLTPIAAALADVRENELAMLQVLFQPVRNPWAESILRSVTLGDGAPLFEGMRDFVKLGKRKVARPLYAAVVRVCCKSDERARTRMLVRNLAGALAPLGDPEGNELVPLGNDGYDENELAENVVLRRSRRLGMLLNSDELISLVHLPSPSVRTEKLRGLAKKTKLAPALVAGHRLFLGYNEHLDQTTRVTLNPEQRAKHIHVVGASGTGKSTFLLNLILQDIQNGDGLAVLDPHGDLIDGILARIPESRANDVVLIDPADEEYPVGFNILSARSELEKNLISSDLIAVFRRLSTSWGDQMNAVLGNAIIAFLESSRGGTLVDLRRFLVESAFRKEFLSTVRDPEIVYFWTKEYPLLKGRPEGPVLTRLDTFLRPKLIRYMVGQKESKLDFEEVMNGGRILLARLSHGAIGAENAYLFGTLLVSKIHQIALKRQELPESDRRYFWLYVDEFQNFATPSMAGILSGVRKYRVGLTLAHQEMRQLNTAAPEVASAISANAFTRVYFRVGSDDAKKLAEGLKGFDSMDLQNLATGEAVCRVEKPECDFNLRTLPLSNASEPSASYASTERILGLSRTRYGVHRREVEEHLNRSSPETAITPALAPLAEKSSSEAVVPYAPESPVSNIEPKRKAPDRRRPSPPAEPPPQGRGGPEHVYLQQFIKQFAEGLGYRASIEENILNGRGVDVALTKGERSIACEICISTDDEHEIGNVKKCLAAEFQNVAVVTPTVKRLSTLEKAMERRLTEAELERVRFFVPENLFAFLRELEINELNREDRVKGYKVQTNYRRGSLSDETNLRDAVSKVVAKAMTRMSERNRSRK